MSVRVQLYGRPGCHLCDAARRVVRSVCDPDGVAWEEIDVDGDPELRERYGELVPVVVVDGEQVAFWRITADQVRAALRR